MSNATITQESSVETGVNNTQAFRHAYKRLNSEERKAEQNAFCRHYRISASAFRARMNGGTKVSDTELAWFQKRVQTYFPN